MNMNIEFTENEKKFLILLIRLGYNLIDSTGRINFPGTGEYFDLNDLCSLADKLDIQFSEIM